MIGQRIVTVIGGLALLSATAIDTLAVIGRHVGIPLTGSIELMQAAVLVAGGSALLAATLARHHARIRLIIDRLSGRRRLAMDGMSDLASAAFYLCLLAGSLWLSIDLWDGHEQSELLGVSWRGMRLFANICLAGAVLACIARLLQGWRGR